MLLLTASLVVGLFAYRDLWTLKPYAVNAAYTNISRVAADGQGFVYTITDSKRTLIKVDPNGELVYKVSSNRDAERNTIQMFNSVAADEQGNAYALLTILDSYGFKVSGERIVKLSADGSRQSVLYEASYSDAENLLRVGKIQSLKVIDGYLYFFRKEADSAVLLRSSAEPGAAKGGVEVMRTIEMPPDRYVFEMTGSDPEHFYFTTKRGRLFQAGVIGAPTQLYPAANTAQLNFPVQIYTNDGTHVYFIDYHNEAVQRLNSAVPGDPAELLIKMDTLRTNYPGTEWSDFTDVFVRDGTIIAATEDAIIQADPSGTIRAVKDSYHYPWSAILLRFCYWGVIIAIPLMVFLTMRYAYIHLMKRSVSLLVKQLGVLIPIILVAMIGLSYTIYVSFSNKMVEEMRGELELLAGNGKYLVAGADLERINSPLDFMSDSYRSIKRRMNDLFSQAGENRNGLYSTVYRYVDGALYTIADDDDSVTIYKPFPTSEDNLQVLQHGSIVSGEWTDATGEWMYALGPLYGTNGDIIGIYETGKDMNGFRQNMRNILSQVLKLIGLVSLVILIVVTAMTVYLLSSIRRLRRSVNLVARGEWDTEVRIRTRDEVAELGERFNMMAGSIRKYIQEVTTLNDSYIRFVPQSFLNVLGKTSMTQVRLGDQVNRKMTVLVCNMREFSGFSSALSPEDNFRFINSFLKQFGPIVRQFGGFTSRYLGPGLLALFPNDPVDALKTAVQMRGKLEDYNSHRQNSGYEPIDIGISVHIGEVMIGIIGEEARMEGSVVSDQVHLASELEKASHQLGSSILLTEEALAACKPGQRWHYRRLGAVQIHGMNRKLELFDVYEGDPEPIRKLKRETQQKFEQGVELYRNGRFHDAREAFVSVVRLNRNDLAAKLYFFASDQYYQQGVAADWNGAIQIQ
jgi:class 3 adenylate cyclase/HAMP domain-containing protein